MKIFDILNEQDSEESNNTPKSWTKSEIGVMNTLIKKGFDETEPTTIREFLVSLGYDNDEAIDLFYLFKNNVINGEFDTTKEPDRERHWEDYNREQIALAIWLNLDPAEIEEQRGSHYGLNSYNTPDGEYAVGNDKEADDAAFEYAKQAIDEGIVNEDFLSDYIYMTNTDRRLYAQEEADNREGDMDDDEIIDKADIQDEIDAVDDEESETQDRISEIESEIDDLEIELAGLDEEEDATRINEITEELEPLRQELKSLESIDFEGKREELIDEAREKVREKIYDDTYDELDDPIEYFIRVHGFYRDVSELIKSGPVLIDDDKAAQDMVDQDGRGHLLSGYDGDENDQEYDGVTYYIYRTN